MEFGPDTFEEWCRDYAEGNYTTDPRVEKCEFEQNTFVEWGEGRVKANVAYDGRPEVVRGDGIELGETGQLFILERGDREYAVEGRSSHAGVTLGARDV